MDSVFEFQPEKPVRLTYRYRTAIMQGHDGNEQRQSLLRNPATSLAIGFFVDDESELRTLRAGLLLDPAGALKLPAWWDPDVTDDQKNAGSAIWSVDTTYSPVVAGDSAFALSPDGTLSDAFVVDSVTATTIVATAPISDEYPLGTRIYRVTDWFAARPYSLSRLRTGQEVARFDVSAPSAVLSGNGGTYDTYQASGDSAARVALYDAPLERGGLSYSIDGKVERVANHGMWSQFTGLTAALSIERRTYRIGNRQALRDWEAILNELFGMREPLYVPTFRNDLELVSQPLAGATTLIVQDTPATYYQTLHPERYENLRLYFADGTEQSVEVLSITDLGSTLQLNLDSALPTPAVNVDRISFLEHCRLGSDDITLTHDGCLGTISIVTQTVADPTS
jgi:hypothetical protein